MSKPTVFALDEADIKIILKPDEVFESVLAPPAPKRKLRTLFWSALAGLISLVILTSLYSFIENMFIKAPWLGWVAAGVTAVLLLTSIVVMWQVISVL